MRLRELNYAAQIFISPLVLGEKKYLLAIVLLNNWEKLKKEISNAYSEKFVSNINLNMNLRKGWHIWPMAASEGFRKSAKWDVSLFTVVIWAHSDNFKIVDSAIQNHTEHCNNNQQLAKQWELAYCPMIWLTNDSSSSSSLSPTNWPMISPPLMPMTVGTADTCRNTKSEKAQCAKN